MGGMRPVKTDKHNIYTTHEPPAYIGVLLEEWIRPIDIHRTDMDMDRKNTRSYIRSNRDIRRINILEREGGQIWETINIKQ